MINKIEQLIEKSIVDLFKKYPQLTPKVMLGGIAVTACIAPLAIYNWPIVVVGTAAYFFIKSVSAIPEWLEKLKAAADGIETVEPVDVTPKKDS